jgi:hypothetical protein
MSDSEYQELPVIIFEEAPLYSKVSWCTEKGLNRLKIPAIHLHCVICNTERTFQQAGIYNTVSGFPWNKAGESIAVWFKCAYCQNSKYVFLIRFSEDCKYLMKVGQYPPPDRRISRQLARVLGDYEEIFSKGITCERFGYGIAAFAYYRRIIELIIDKLVSIVEDMLSEDERIAHQSALDIIRSSHVAEEKIRLVKNILPTSLRPDGFNPLAVMHESLSDGLHSRTDEECLLIASQVRSAMTYLVEKVENEKLITKQSPERAQFNSPVHRTGKYQV